MVKKILLIDHDSCIPNIALMKLSAWHRREGDRTFLDFCDGKPDKVYISKVFRASPRINRRMPFTAGGSGLRDLSIKLPDEIEHIMPDYDLYGTKVAAGYCSRGCPNKCGFCYVPKKEGAYKRNADIYEFWNKKMPAVRVMDNNILFDKEWFMHISDQILKEGILWDISQAIDARLVDDDIAQRLGIMVKVSRRSDVRFSWDTVNQNSEVLRGLELLLKYIPPSKIFSYVLTGYNTTYEQDLFRVETLGEYGVRMSILVFDRKRFSPKYDTELLMLFARWASRKRLVGISFPDFLDSAGRSHMKKYIGAELHVCHITGPRPDGIPRAKFLRAIKRKWLNRWGIWNGLV